LKELKNPTFGELSKEIEQLIAKGRMDVPASLCFVASIGDSLLMEQLLKSGMDPNESDCNSCTPLVNFKIKIHFDHYSFMVFLFLATLLLHSCDSYVQYFLISRHN